MPHKEMPKQLSVSISDISLVKPSYELKKCEEELHHVCSSICDKECQKV